MLGCCYQVTNFVLLGQRKSDRVVSENISNIVSSMTSQNLENIHLKTLVEDKKHELNCLQNEWQQFNSECINEIKSAIELKTSQNVELKRLQQQCEQTQFQLELILESNSFMEKQLSKEQQKSYEAMKSADIHEQYVNKEKMKNGGYSTVVAKNALEI